MIEVGLYREAVTTQSPGLLQPWLMNEVVNSTRNGLQPQLESGTLIWKTTQPLRLKSSAGVFPRVEATLGFGA